MPFRCRQKMLIYGAGEIFFTVGTPNPDTGVVEFSDVPQQCKLPDVEMTDLSTCLKAGVSLERVNCKLISPDTRSLVAKLRDIKDGSSVSGSDVKPENNPETK